MKHGQYINATQTQIILSLKLVEKNIKIKWQDKIPDTNFKVLEKAGMHTYGLKATAAQINWTCCKNVWTSKESFLKGVACGKALSKWLDEAMQRHTQSLPE